MISQDTLLPPQVITLYWHKFSSMQQEWWCSLKPQSLRKIPAIPAQAPTVAPEPTADRELAGAF
ncbi:hypothetical protein AVDCRST_MAG94-1016 [uncultured Leptolyngbya sp.]|uniref:Uncharacterized protein n=1 Tax=uncultured Leptolyngbya sp. TaxID=332963 RepID=A0A6J4KUN4_9CYAN|nr:hypothetical protein AVDCRST_MAG94-1016 [uncultured Leptolyngbya sp.]